MRIAIFCAIACLLPLNAADPKAPVFWKASKLSEFDKQLPSKVNPERHLGTERLLDSSFVLYRNGPSEGEIHTDQADFIICRNGEGTILVGGKLVEGKSTAPGELRGKAIDGGTKYVMTTGDTLYVPANTPHQFQVESGKHFTATIIKITPKQ